MITSCDHILLIFMTEYYVVGSCWIKTDNIDLIFGSSSPQKTVLYSSESYFWKFLPHQIQPTYKIFKILQNFKCIPGDSGFGLAICSIGVTLRMVGLRGFDSEDFLRLAGLPVRLSVDRFKPEVEGAVSSPVLLTF